MAVAWFGHPLGELRYVVLLVYIRFCGISSCYHKMGPCGMSYFRQPENIVTASTITSMPTKFCSAIKTKLYCLVTEAHACEQLALAGSGPAEIRPLDLWVASELIESWWWCVPGAKSATTIYDGTC